MNRRIPPSIALALLTSLGFHDVAHAAWNGTSPPRTPGDLDGDGVSDLALVGGLNGSTIPVVFSNVDGTWRAPATSTSSTILFGWGLSTTPTTATFAQWATQTGAMPVSGDFNGDGKMDVALTGGSGWSTIPIAFGNGNGTFYVTNTGVANFPGYASQAGVTAVAGDFNGDGRDDIALVGGSGWNTVPVAFSYGNGAFWVTNTYVPGFPSWAAQTHVRPVAGDFNGDGRGDIAITGGSGWNTVPVAFSNGSGGFNVTNSYVPLLPTYASQPNALPVAGDFNGDGRNDIALTGGAWTFIPVALSAGDGTFRVSNNDVPNLPGFATQPGAKPVGGDFNGDGWTDIALVGGDGWSTLPVGFSNGDGTFRVTNAGVLDFPQLAVQPGAQPVGAWSSPGRGLIQTPGWCDPAPSVATCTSLQYQQSACAPSTKTACTNAIINTFTNSAHGTTNTTAILEPGGMPHGDHLTDAKYTAFNTSAMTGHLNGGSYSTSAMVGMPLAVNYAAQHPDWEAHGTMITSCKEYAYKRYYDYARFEEAAATCAGDDDCIYGVAMLNDNPGLGMRLTMYDNTDRSQRTGLMFQTQYDPVQGKVPQLGAPPAQQAKNAFFREDITQLMNLFPGASSDPELQAIRAAIQSADSPSYYDTTDRWAWHRSMHDSQYARYGTITPDERTANDQRLQNYQELLAQVDAVEASLHGSYTTQQCTCTNKPCPLPIAGQPAPPGYTCTNVTDGRLRVAIGNLLAALRVEWHHVDPHSTVANPVVDHGCLDVSSIKCDWSPKQFGREYTGLLGGERAAAYQRCTAAFTPNDFATVSDFTSTTKILFPNDIVNCRNLEAAFPRALQHMDDVASKWPWLTPATADAGDRKTLGIAFPKDEQSYGLHGFLEARWDYGGSWTMTAHKSSSEQLDYLDSEAKAYAYASFTLPRTSLPDPGDLVLAPPPGVDDPKALFNIAVDNVVDNLFAHTYTVVDGSFDATAGKAGVNGGFEVTGHLIFMGKQILGPFDEKVYGNKDYEGPSYDNRVNVYNTMKPFTVFGIPCYVSLNVAANYGYTTIFNIAGYGGNTGTPSLANEKFQFQFLPKARIDAVGSLGIGVPGLSVGVRGEVTVAKLDLPFNINMSFEGTTYDNLILNLHTDAAIHALLLDGRISVFIDYLIDTAEAEIFSWHGLPFDPQLWNEDVRITMPMFKREFTQ